MDPMPTKSILSGSMSKHMANLLYVTGEVLQKLHGHPAYQFWRGIIHNLPIRITPLEERSFHPREMDIDENFIYLTTDLKFAYCRDKMFSFLYETQDLSFRLTCKDGILRTLDNKQFTALIGKVGKAMTSTEIALVNDTMVYHPLMDSGFFGKPRLDGDGNVPDQDSSTATLTEKPDLILGKFSHELAEQVMAFRDSSKKSYKYLAGRFGMAEKDIKAICEFCKKQEAADEQSDEATEALKEIPKDLQETIVRMKKVSKKSYKHLSEKFELPVETIQDICAKHLKRPRKRRKSSKSSKSKKS